MTKYEIINLIVFDLNKLNVSGIENMENVLRCVKRMRDLTDKLMEEDENHKKAEMSNE